ncbi:MAG TPA: glutathione S-transferase N-terminal domain-containing protein [Stellaceae bacterium]|nr:glutathione S-transferase N-terminal domain-containing protein [Stellaceae bacterium]
MIELHAWGTPNGRKPLIMLEETGLPYELHKVNIGKGEQFAPAFLKLSPNGKIPAILDHEGPGGKPVSVFESGAILIYLAEKTGKFMSAEPRARIAALEWLMFQMGGVGPMFGQAHHFLRQAPEPIPYAQERYVKEVRRLYGVMNVRLGEAAYLAGDYSIADIATYPWVARYSWHKVELAEFPNVERWFKTIGARPAVERGMAVAF